MAHSLNLGTSVIEAVRYLTNQNYRVTVKYKPSTKAAYIATWLEVLKNDNRAILAAAAHAQRAADYLNQKAASHITSLIKDAVAVPGVA